MASFHAIFTVLLVLIFIGIVIWAYSPKRKSSFDEAAQLPFADEPDSNSTGGSKVQSGARKRGEKT